MQRAFTLIELVVVVCIILLLCCIVFSKCGSNEYDYSIQVDGKTYPMESYPRPDMDGMYHITTEQGELLVPSNNVVIIKTKKP